VMLRPESYGRWLDQEAHSAVLKELLVPFPAQEMKSHPVSSEVNYPDNDNEDLIVRVDAEVGITPSLF